MLHVFLLSLLLGFLPTDETDHLEKAARRIAEAEMRDGQVFAILTSLCDGVGHRLSGSPQAERAVEWGVEAFEQFGLENVRRHRIMVRKWVRGEREDIAIIAPTHHQLEALALGGSIATPAEGVTASVLVVASEDELKSRADEARGRIVLFDLAMGETADGRPLHYGQVVPQRTNGAIWAARAGAAGSLIRSVGTADWRLPHTGAMLYEDGVPRIPHAAISTEDANLIGRLIDAGHDVRVRMRLDCRDEGEVESANVIAELRGRELPQEVVVISGHLDSWDVGQGAHDDGAGVAATIEAMRLLKQLDLRPRRTIRAILYMNEENGLAGGKAYAADHEHELEDHVAAIEMDSGGFAPKGFGVSAGDGDIEVAQRIEPLLELVGAGMITAGGGGADIGAMRPFGVPQIGMRTHSDRYFDYHHTNADTLDKVDPTELKKCAAAMAILAFALAEMEETLPRLE